MTVLSAGYRLVVILALLRRQEVDGVGTLRREFSRTAPPIAKWVIFGDSALRQHLVQQHNMSFADAEYPPAGDAEQTLVAPSPPRARDDYPQRNDDDQPRNGGRSVTSRAANNHKYTYYLVFAVNADRTLPGVRLTLLPYVYLLSTSRSQANSTLAHNQNPVREKIHIRKSLPVLELTRAV